jgi:poly(3-hydroxybutyrate) depolymerase
MPPEQQMPDMGDETTMAAAAPQIAAGASEPSGGMEVPVPLDALAMPGEDDKMNAPSVGDPVQLQAEGTVTRVEGDTAFVSIKSVNGKPVTPEGAKTTNTLGEDENGDNEFAQLRSEAGQQEGAM